MKNVGGKSLSVQVNKAIEKENKIWESNAIGNIVIIYQSKGELDKSLELFEKGLKLYEDLGRKEGIALLLGNIGVVHQTKGELDKSLVYFEKAFKLNEEFGLKEGIANQLGNIGVIYLIKGELSNALEY